MISGGSELPGASVKSKAVSALRSATAVHKKGAQKGECAWRCGGVAV
ncbi:MAG: hypothetical protein ABSG59_00095 [Verrucomicrobiota bacterium]|jgi:hypothetical protein